MKIVSSQMAHSSDSHFEQLNSSSEQRLQERIEKRSSGQNRRFRNRRRMMNRRDLPQIIVDRVSISQNQTREYQLNYTADISAASLVTSLTSEEKIEHERQSAIEKLVGGVIEKEVVINSLQPEETGSLSGETPQQQVMPGNVSDASRTNLSEEWKMSVKKTDIHFEDEIMDFKSKGEVITEDGRKIDFSLDMSLNRTFFSKKEQETLVHHWQEKVTLIDPLVISLDGRMPELTTTKFEFDLNMDGKMEQVSFAGQGSGFLAFDKNNDHVINDGSELFGPGTGNGFEELSAFDMDQNHWIDENDAVFSKLSVWMKNEEGESVLMSLKDAGIGAISLDYAATSFQMAESDNTLQGQLKSTGVFLFEDGNIGSVHQIDLASQPLNEEGRNRVVPVQTDKTEPITTDPVIPAPVRREELSEDVSNPLKDLLERLEKLKEQMQRLYEKMNPSEGHRRMKRSGRNRYQHFSPDSDVLLFGHKGPVRSRRRYV